MIVKILSGAANLKLATAIAGARGTHWEEEGFWNVYRATTAEVPTRGNLVPDAHLAALLRQHGVKTLYTHDRDFLKFPFLHVRDPLVGNPTKV